MLESLLLAAHSDWLHVFEESWVFFYAVWPTMIVFHYAVASRCCLFQPVIVGRVKFVDHCQIASLLCTSVMLSLAELCIVLVEMMSCRRRHWACIFRYSSVRLCSRRLLMSWRHSMVWACCFFTISSHHQSVVYSAMQFQSTSVSLCQSDSTAV